MEYQRVATQLDMSLQGKMLFTCPQPGGCEPLPGLCSPHCPAPPSSPFSPTQPDLCKCSLEKSHTNATCVTISYLGHAIWGHIWKHTVEKSQSQTNAAPTLGPTIVALFPQNLTFATCCYRLTLSITPKYQSKVQELWNLDQNIKSPAALLEARRTLPHCRYSLVKAVSCLQHRVVFDESKTVKTMAKLVPNSKPVLANMHQTPQPPSSSSQLTLFSHFT